METKKQKPVRLGSLPSILPTSSFDVWIWDNWMPRPVPDVSILVKQGQPPLLVAPTYPRIHLLSVAKSDVRHFWKHWCPVVVWLKRKKFRLPKVRFCYRMECLFIWIWSIYWIWFTVSSRYEYSYYIWPVYVLYIWICTLYSIYINIFISYYFLYIHCIFEYISTPILYSYLYLM